MATSEIRSRTVQEMDRDDDDQLLQRYVVKDSNHHGYHTSTPLMDIPVIDFHSLTFSSLENENELQKLRCALYSWGCFQVVNHGIENSLLDELRDVGKKFFALPKEEKRKCERAADHIEGYGNDMIFSENQTLDWTDRLYLQVSPEDARKLRYWPQEPLCFREILNEYTKKLEELVTELLKFMAKSLNLAETCFLEQYGTGPLMHARFNFYPQCPKPDEILGLKPHADGSAITILLQDTEVEGLQLQKGDEWFRVPILPHALLVNVGDQLEIMSNGLFKSPVHRAVTSSKSERMTIAMFCSPETGKEIEPLEELIDDKRPRVYKKVKNYVETYMQYYQQGKRPIDAVKI